VAGSIIMRNTIEEAGPSRSETWVKVGLGRVGSLHGTTELQVRQSLGGNSKWDSLRAHRNVGGLHEYDGKLNVNITSFYFS